MCKEDAGILRKVVDANPQLVFIKDWDGRLVLANQAVAELYGSTPEELEGKTDADFNANAAEVENYLKADREVMQSGRPLHVPEESVTHPNGEIRWFQTMKVGAQPTSTQPQKPPQPEKESRQKGGFRTSDSLQAAYQQPPLGAGIGAKPALPSALSPLPPTVAVPQNALFSSTPLLPSNASVPTTRL
jgi:PAS domain S-box-containing protein